MAFSTRSRLALALAISSACGDDSDPGQGTQTDGMTTATGSTTLTSSSTTPTGGDTDTDGSTTDATTTEADTSTGAPIVCPDTHACLAVPEGWAGPMLLRESSDARGMTECPAAYPTAEVLGGSELVADAAECSCACGEATGTSCALATTLHYWGPDATCSAGNAQSFEVFTTVCNPIVNPFPAGSHFQVDPVLVEGGACVPESGEAITAATFARNASACAGAEFLEGCAPDEVCAPVATDEALCVWQAGDSECPEGFEGQRELYFTTIEDDRGCTECSCADPVGLCDAATITMFANLCNPPVTGVLPATGECYPGSPLSASQSAIFNVGEPAAFCMPGAVEPTGSASGTSPVTVCCAG